MATTTFTITFDDGESASLSAEYIKPKFINGWWSYDKEGKEIYTYGEEKNRLALGETVYFHVHTQGIKEGKEIKLQLYDYDHFFWVDQLNIDTSKFPNDTVIKKGKVQKVGDKYITTIALLLDESWEPVIHDDHDDKPSLDHNIELYWRASCDGLSKNIPNKEEDYLKVTYSTRTLYIKPPYPGHNLPEFITNDGSPMLLMEMAKVPDNQIKNMAKNKIFDAIDKKIDKTISNIAFVKLEKGYLYTNTGDVIENAKAQIYTSDVYTNDGELLKNVKKRKNIGYDHHGKPKVTTKGISQYDYFTKTGRKGKILGMVKYATGETTEMKALGAKASKNMSSFLDVFDLMKFATEDLDTSKPLSLPLGPLSPLNDLAGVLVQEQKAEMDMWLEEVIQRDIDKAKLQGLAATRKAINSWHDDLNTWDLLPVSSITATKLLQGEFKTMNDLLDYDSNIESFNSNTTILYRTVKNENREDYIDVIETLFINE